MADRSVSWGSAGREVVVKGRREVAKKWSRGWSEGGQGVVKGLSGGWWTGSQVGTDVFGSHH